MKPRFGAALATLACVSGCVTPPPVTVLSTPGAPPLQPVALATLPGWTDDNVEAALASFITSCKALALMPPDQSLGGIGLLQQSGGQAGQL